MLKWQTSVADLKSALFVLPNTCGTIATQAGTSSGMAKRIQ